MQPAQHLGDCPLRSIGTPGHNQIELDLELQNALQNLFEETASAMERGLDAADRFDQESRRIRCVLAFGEFEFLARRWMRHGWRVERDISLRVLTDPWCHKLTDSAEWSD